MEQLSCQAGVRVALPLATGAARLVSVELRAPRGPPPEGPEGPISPPYLCCWEEVDSVLPKFYIPLKGCRVVNNITELGPCLYIISATGEFEFQCPNSQVCSEWINILKGHGASLLRFTDLYRLTGFIVPLMEAEPDGDAVRVACGISPKLVKISAALADAVGIFSNACWGEGSFAKVYIGRHMLTGEDVVIKAVDKKKVVESNVYTEIEVLRNVSHPYIMRLYAAYEQGKANGESGRLYTGVIAAEIALASFRTRNPREGGWTKAAAKTEG
ncbi:CAM snf1 domain-containing protein [Cyclospora cayetanensis]|uniref:CAM snf1 domain-containing protein n=1 Tax=Cyclospora cayetanensis TaxID=88456 RepID=A0A1D3D4H4_9EIME|nr:CAM snf1 domain-containing protein [Cyclospora cayetanensis]